MNLYDDEGNAAELSFGPEFRDAVCMTNDELLAVLDKQKRDLTANGQSVNDVFEQTLSYVTKVVPPADPDLLRAASRELRVGIANMELTQEGGAMSKLHFFEVAVLSNLVPAEGCEVDEAFAWIPSLRRFEVAQVEALLQRVVEAKARAV